MDYLDHSMHIAEYDWTSFYEDCEECCVLQPLLAYHDSSSLSESEDSESSVFSTSQQEPQPSSAANWDDAESSAAGCCMEEENCTGCLKYMSVQCIQSGSGEGQEDLTTKAKLCLNHPEGTTIPTAEHNTEKTNDNITDTLQTKQLNVQSSDGDVQMKSDIRELKSTQESDPLPCSRTELNVNEPHTTDITVSEDVSGGALRAEKERWFVTVNDGPARQQVCAASVKRKRRQKKTRKDDHMWRPGQEKSLKSSLRFEIMKDKNESEGGTFTEHVTQANQNLVQKSGGYLSAEEDPENVQMVVISDLSLVTSGDEDNLSKELVMSHSTKDNNIEPTIDRTSQNTSTSASTTHKDLLRFYSVESDELEDDLKFFSTHSFDSESYLSATESVEEFQHLLVEHQQLHSSSSLTENSYLFDLTENTKAYQTNTQDREVPSCASTLSCNEIATNAKGHESADVQSTLTFPSAGQSADKMPDDNSTCDNDTHSTLPPNTPGLQKHEGNLSASDCSSGDQLLPVPDLTVTVTVCSVADSPETYAEAAGHTRPVYAISAFWDEMEKLTIHDILQLRMGRSTPPREKQETVTPSVDDHSSLINTAEYNLLDGGLMDTSDTADSDYFTQPDESKPDRSSCEFSTSDFEEENWQFLGASRNPNPDSQSKKQQSTSDSPFLVHEEEDSTGSEGKETPVPLKDLASECFKDQDSNAFISSKPSWPRQMTKSKSMHNVQALNTEDSSLQLLLGNDESCRFLSSCPSLEENVVLNAGDSVGTLIPAPFLDEHYQVSFPEVFEYLLRENKTKRDLQCVTFYDPEDILVAPVFDYNLFTFRDEMSFFSLHDYQRSDERPIPIFSCPHPTVRELTFPHQNYVFLSADCEEEDDISPIRVVSRSFIQGSDCGAAATHGFYSWKSLMRKIHFPDKGSIWCRRSGALVFPVEAEKITMKSADPTITVLTERRVTSTPSQLFRELAVQQRVLKAIRTTRREGIFSTLKQSDMCLVCIAFASWVLKSSDPETADAWKAALLANVSALSAIQYLRQYVKKKNPS